MKKSVLFLVFLLVLFGCAAQTKKDGQPAGADFRFGTEGLSMSFVGNMPPPRLFDSSPFIVTLMIENKGTISLLPASTKIYLSGFDPSIIENIGDTGESLKTELRGRSVYISKGDVDAVTFNGDIPDISIEKYQPTILATACYKYATTANPAVCLDPNPYTATSVQKVCTPGTISLGSQGAPVAVTSVEVDATPGTTRFKINIQNVGGGDVFDIADEALKACSPYVGLKFNQIDVIHIYDVLIGGTTIKSSCRPVDAKGNLRLANGVGTLFCELSGLSGQNAYISPMTIDLSYGYRQSITKQVEIRNTPETAS